MHANLVVGIMRTFAIDNLKKFLFCTVLATLVLTLLYHRTFFRFFDSHSLSSFTGVSHLTSHVDVHFENSYSVHITGDGNSLNNSMRTPNGRVLVAVGGGITSARAGDHTMNVKTQFSVLSPFLKSFCHTASTNYDYGFYFAYDWSDSFFNNQSMFLAFLELFRNHSKLYCPQLNISLHMVQCHHGKKPAWAQNDAMMEAYLDGAEYFYRVNDDTVFLTTDWTNIFVQKLSQFDPPNLGVVGPNHSGGELSILTYDFVHRTHVDIFGFYYPRHFTDWFADSWITSVYSDKYMLKVQEVKVRHVMSLGTRYNPNRSRREKFDELVSWSKQILSKYQHSKQYSLKVNHKRVMSMSLYGTEATLNMGAIRNAQLFPIYFPDWTLRIYAHFDEGLKPVKHPLNNELLVPLRIVETLRRLGAQVVFVDSNSKSLRPEMWSYLVVDDDDVDYFLVRNAFHRINFRDHLAVQDFIRKSEMNSKGTDIKFHCMRDRASHLNVSVVPGLWGGNRHALEEVFKGKGFLSKVLEMLQVNESILEAKLLHELLWRSHKEKFLCHDSVSCFKKWSPMSVRFPDNSVLHGVGDFLGVSYDRHQQPINFSLLSEHQERFKIGQLCDTFEVHVDPLSDSMISTVSFEKPNDKVKEYIP